MSCVRRLTPAVAFLLFHAPLAAQSAAGGGGPTDVVYFDWIEDGVLRGTVLPVDPTNPLLAATEGAGTRASSAWTTLVSNGPPANRVDVVFVGDGYTAGELGSYAAEVQGVLAAFLSEHPLDEYVTYLNVHRVDVVSPQSGVDNDPTQGVMKNTALDMGYWCGGVQRALCISVSKALVQAANAPDVDQILALAHSATYGGSGYPASNLGTLAGGNSAAIEIALHEFGHSFADLADEYDYGGPTTWPGGEPGSANVSTYNTTSMAAQQKKWFRWLPEPNVATFEGANYSSFGIYRPTNDSLMRNLYRPLEQVNVEQFVFALYRTVRPIDGATLPGIYGSGHVFFVDPLDPVGHALNVQWSVDGSPVPGATSLTFDVSTLGLPLGSHTVSVEVVDNTTLVRDETKRAQLMRQVQSWTIDDSALVLPYGCGVNLAGSLVHASGLPRLGQTVVFELDNPMATNAPGSVPVLVLSLAADPHFPCGTLLPNFNMNPMLPGELLVSLDPGALVLPFLIGPPYGGWGTPPVPVAVSVPNSSSLLGTSVFVQGVMFDPVALFGMRYPLTEAVQLRIGS